MIDGDAGRSVIDSLADVSPALSHHIAAFAFGDVYDRPGLDARSRQLVTIGVLTALGGCCFCRFCEKFQVKAANT